MTPPNSSRWSTLLRPLLFSIFAALFAVVGCGDSASSESNDDWETFGIPGPFDLEGPTGKADGAGIPSIGTDWDNSETQVWAVTSQWEDRDTTNAKKAGVAWGANSGLNWGST